MRVLESDPTFFLVELSDIESGALPEPARASRGALEQVVVWAKEYLCRPHPELGREGAVCPFVQASMDKQLFLLSVCPGRDFEQEEVVARVMRYRDYFLDLEPRSGPESLLKTLLILFPDIPLADVPRLIDTTQERLKPEYVKKGLMIGEFHAIPPAKPGLWNPDFRPLRCPVSMLVIRHMVSSDFAFLRGERDFVAAYLDNYGDQVPPHLKETVSEAAQRYGLAVEEPPLHPRVRAALQRAGVSYKIHRHTDQPFPIQGPEDFARALGYPIERITKSLFLRCQCHGKYFVVVCPVKKKLNLGRVAVLVGCKRLEPASPEELAILLGYPSQGVPPVAVGSTQVLMDEELLEHETVLAAAGEVEVEIEMAPSNLRRVSRALLFSARMAVKAA
ncbi:MAG TPA: YbaK/EbsC family protein [Thermoanaerobaculia bacterium]|nr:YbaK/EbsC family protein [Thermoanaerobaculia bacterium]